MKLFLKKFQSFKTKTVPIFYILTAVNCLIWVALVPLWGYPDEQAHFGQVAFLAEQGRNPIGEELDLTREIEFSEDILGTRRDALGKNKYTHHPEYKIEYESGKYGISEKELISLSISSNGRELTAREATRYPIWYYLGAKTIYKLFYSSDIITRVFAVRMYSVFLYLVTIFVIYKCSQLLFSKLIDRLTITMMVSFQPMMVFANTGVNSDSLGNLLGILMVYLSLILLKMIELKRFILFSAVLIFGILNKINFLAFTPVLVLFMVMAVLKFMKDRQYAGIIIILVLVFAGSKLILYSGGYGLGNWLGASFNPSSFLKFTREYSIPHLYNEVMPWYWGVYKWLGVTYPRIVHRIINMAVYFGILGFVVGLIRLARDKQYSGLVIPGLFILYNLSYIFGLFLYDWLSWYKSGFQLGIQGRYFFPIIITHMYFILSGWKVWQKMVFLLSIKTLGISILLLNLYGLSTVCMSYYDLSGWQIFTNQASQYKPVLFKYPVIDAWLGIFFVFYLLFTVKYLKLPDNSN